MVRVHSYAPDSFSARACDGAGEDAPDTGPVSRLWPGSGRADDGGKCGSGGGGGGAAGTAGGVGGAAGRLNLLLSCASWRHDSWADRLPFLLEPMGVHSVRARTARQAEHVIRTVTVHIAVVDLGLPLDERDRPAPVGSSGAHPEEAGPRILELLRRLESPPPTVVVKAPQTQRDDRRNLAAALRCDAFAVVDRTSVDMEQMLEVLRRCLTRFYHDRWPGGGPLPLS